MAKQTVVYQHNEILPRNKNRWPIDTPNNMDESQKHYAKWKKTALTQNSTKVHAVLF